MVCVSLTCTVAHSTVHSRVNGHGFPISPGTENKSLSPSLKTMTCSLEQGEQWGWLPMGSVRSSSRGGSNQSSNTKTRLNHIPLGPSGFQWGLVVWLFLKALFFSHSFLLCQSRWGVLHVSFFFFSFFLFSLCFYPHVVNYMLILLIFFISS